MVNYLIKVTIICFKLQVEETQARNHELEKKQRKFDSEMCGQQAETTQHKIEKDKSVREKESSQTQLVKAETDSQQKSREEHEKSLSEIDHTYLNAPPPVNTSQENDFCEYY